METDYSQRTIESPVGDLTLRAGNGRLCSLEFGRKDPENILEVDRAVLEMAGQQLAEYFAGKRKNFTVPLALSGTDFQKKIWEELRAIPFGEVRSYQGLAAAAGSPKGARAAGMACHNNPIAIIVPCHRVLSTSRKLTGFAGGLDVKRALLKLEGITWRD